MCSEAVFLAPESCAVSIHMVCSFEILISVHNLKVQCSSVHGLVHEHERVM